MDLFSAFSASGAKALAYAVISRLLLSGGQTPADLAIFTLIRSTLGLMNYATLGIAPAFIRQVAVLTGSPGASEMRGAADLPRERLYASALYPALGVGAIALLLLVGYSIAFNPLNNNSAENVPGQLLRYAPLSAFLVGLGMLARLISDVPGGYLQASHRITLDNCLLALGDLAWPMLSLVLIRSAPTPLLGVSLAFCVCYVALSVSRFVAACGTGLPFLPKPGLMERAAAGHMLRFGLLLTLSQLSDFLYAPTDFLLITWFVPAKAEALSAYSVAVQLDAGLLLLTSAVATVLYPRASHAVAARDIGQLRRYYQRGTVLTTVLLVSAALVVWVAARPLLLVWLGADMPLTRRILPLLFLHTIIGGSSAPARAILFAAGRAKAFAISAVMAGLLNVGISFLLVRYTTMGLWGVVLGTVVAAVLRCLVFLPWYTWRTLENLQSLPLPSAAEQPPIQSTLEEPL